MIERAVREELEHRAFHKLGGLHTYICITRSAVSCEQGVVREGQSIYTHMSAKKVKWGLRSYLQYPNPENISSPAAIAIKLS